MTTEDLRIETRDYEDERTWMRPGCTGGWRQAYFWYSGPANGILIDGWAEEIVGLQTAAAGLPACRGRKCFLLGSTQARNRRVQGQPQSRRCRSTPSSERSFAPVRWQAPPAALWQIFILFCGVKLDFLFDRLSQDIKTYNKFQRHNRPYV